MNNFGLGLVSGMHVTLNTADGFGIRMAIESYASVILSCGVRCRNCIVTFTSRLRRLGSFAFELSCSDPHTARSPHLGPVDEAPALDPDLARRLQDAFARGSGHGLLQLGAGEVGTALPPVFSYWRELGTRYVTALCTLPDAATDPSKAHVPAPPAGELEPLALAAPPMTGAEYLTARSSTLSGRRSTQLLPSSYRSREARSRTSSSAATPRGTWSAACTSISPKTARTSRLPSRFSPPTPPGFPPTPKPSIFRSVRPCANTRARRTRSACCHCSSPFSARPKSVPG